MKIVLQRVIEANVCVDGRVVGSIQRGVVLLVGFGKGDKEDLLLPMAKKVLNLRIFPNNEGRFDLSLLDIGAGILCIPQFTLYADTSRGRRPDFFSALDPSVAVELYERFTRMLKDLGCAFVESGIFGSNMQVSLINDGPVTILL